MKRTRPLLLVALALTLALAAPAAAQSSAPQVDPRSPAGAEYSLPLEQARPQVDPDSPAGTEYELPLDRAREQAGGGSGGASGSGGSASGEAPLFGAGVDSKATSQTTKSRGTSGTDGEPAGTRNVAPGEGVTGTPETVRAQAPAPGDGGSALVGVGAGAGGVLLLGGLAGVFWRRLSRRA